jgi:hypothetical protein
MNCYVNDKLVPCDATFLLFIAIPFALIGLFFLIKPDLFVKYQIWSMKFFGFGNWQPSKRIYAFYKIFGVVFLIVGIVLFGFMFFLKSVPTNPIGLWSIEKIEGTDDVTDANGNSMYAEFLKDGKYCSEFESGTTKCIKYDKYYVINDVLVINQRNDSGYDLGTFYYLWGISNGKLKLSTYFLDIDNNAGLGNWSPISTFILKPISR